MKCKKAFKEEPLVEIITFPWTQFLTAANGKRCHVGNFGIDSLLFRLNADWYNEDKYSG